MRLSEIQNALREQRLDGWLFFDHHRRDPLAYRVLQLDPPTDPTRRWHYLIPAEGEPRKLVHRVESTILDGLPGTKAVYAGWGTLVDGLTRLVGGNRKLAMQYSPRCAIPSLSMVDAGTMELIRSLGVEVVSSADLIQLFEARWDPAKLASHLEAGRRVDAVRRGAFELAGERIRSGALISEHELRQFILSKFEENGLETNHGPIVAVGPNAADPHYEPPEQGSAAIRPGGLLLIDLWAKLKRPGSTYYDSTWVGFCGSKPPDEMQRVFQVVREARDRAVRLIQSAVEKHEPLRGYEVDDAAREYIKAQSYGERFVHRTGHSIGEEVHGAGANMDNLETHDERRVLPWTCFSIEPGIYLDDFGIRLELNVFVDESRAIVTGEVQEALVLV
ncbi:MAG: aminopeptidase P family protein [Bryobacterales bacterium]|nr:aminopeptidase P family protein [Bryobacterales bacterium]